MINKLLANLPFNPSLIEDVSFYAKRLRKEESVRRLGLVLVVISMFIQLFVALSPPEKSFAASDNDVINGGADTLPELKSKCEKSNDANQKLNWGAKDLYARFGIDCSDIVNSKVSNLQGGFKFQSQGHAGVRVIGRNDSPSRDVDLAALGPHKITFQTRPASTWHGKEDAYDFGVLHDSKNSYYHIWILKDCGNIAYDHVSGPTETGTVIGSTPTLTTTGSPGFTPVTPPVTPTPVTPTPVTPTPVTPVVTSCPGYPDLPASGGCICPYNPALPKGSDKCKPEVCKDNPLLKPDDKDCGTVTLLKNVQNVTQNLSPVLTLTTKAKASDVLEYSLVTTNTNVQAAKTGFVVEDYIGDVLDYATVDEASLKTQGGTLSADKKIITWANQTVPAGGKLTNTFRVTMKSVIPSTNQANATAPDFDCKMENGYGNLVTVTVDCPLVKQVEKLPNTGPGATVGIAFGITVVSSYFFARSRLLAKELELVKKDFVAAGA
jgi:hypothetical protein